MHPILSIGVKAAYEAGKILLQSFDRRDTLQIREKNPNDFVSEVDHKAELAIIEILQKAYPKHSFLGEETGASEYESESQWLIDPLDGTNNYLHGIPHFCVSIAYQFRNRVEHAVVFDPIRQELFTASRGEGSFCSQRRIRVNPQQPNTGIVLGTTLPFIALPSNVSPELTQTLNELQQKLTGIRRFGAAALDLAYVAAGRLDGFLGYGCKAWDIAAGSLIVQEAGGFVTDFAGEHDYLQNTQVIASNPKLHHLLQSSIQKVAPELILAADHF